MEFPKPTRFTDFEGVYQPIADAWMIYDNSGEKPKLIEEGP